MPDPAANVVLPPAGYLIGFVGLSRLLESYDFPVLGPAFETRVAADPNDANALLDLATLLFFTLNPDHRPIALECQKRALQITRTFHLRPPAEDTALRLLVIMAPGDLTANTPVDCLLEDAGVAITLHYVVPDRQLPDPLPAHDVVFVAAGESSANQVLLRQLEALPRLTDRPVVNAPDRITGLTRTRVHELLKPIAGVAVAPTAYVTREQLVTATQGEPLAKLLPGGRFPIVVRPVDSQGGKDLARIDGPGELSSYLAGLPDAAFNVANFIDYRSWDGQFRKYRVALLDGRPFGCHMAISSRWMVHYVNADMDASEAKRREEEAFLMHFDRDFVRRHTAALHDIAACIGLDWFAIDCAELADGRLLVFEADNAAIVHALDDPVLYPYKLPAMRRIFDAFRELLIERADRAGPASPA